MANYTPMIQQYLAIKAEVPDAFLFFRLGDFYELFFEDAIRASRELEITLTGRDGGAAEKIPMCGVPYHSSESYISRLVQKGYKVAICEQVEDPSQAKGVVRREIVRIVTPGTAMEGRTLSETGNNFILSLFAEEGGYALAACDLTTGEVYVTHTRAGASTILEEAGVYAPSEVLAPPGMVKLVEDEAARWPRTAVVTAWERSADEQAVLQFGAARLDELPDSSRTAVSRLLGYLLETQKRSLSHLTKIKEYETEQFMVLDPFTRRNLELTETVRDRSRKGSLLWVLDKTVTAMGGRMLRRWIDKPLVQRSKIEERLEAVGVLNQDLILREEIRTALRDVYDLERLVARICFGTANARDLTALRVSLEKVPIALQLCRESQSQTLRALVADTDACEDIAAWIASAIQDEPPVSVREGGMIRDGYDPHLDKLREASTGGKQWLAELERKEREATGIKTLKIGFNKVFGYYIEVTRANLSALPEGKYERKQTLANAERFVTPELKEKEALILEAEERMVGLEYELFSELRTRIAGENLRMQKLAEVIAALDCLQSFAEVSAKRQYRKPQLTEGFDLQIKEGRHPVVEAVMPGQSFIRNDTQLLQDRGTMLITGPNMAGKSTYMRQVALIAIMAQIGCFVPAESASIPVIDRVFTRIGAADDLIGGQSTFMVEMMDIRVMTERATPRSLVIIDELGRGTSTGEGMAIAQAVIEFLHNQIGCKTLVSTHFHELAHLEESLSSLRNYSMTVKESGEQVTFLRKLAEGAASTSYGIYCARVAGLPGEVIERAYALLSRFERREAELARETGPALEAADRQEAADNRQVKQLSLFEQTDDPWPREGKLQGPTARERAAEKGLSPGRTKEEDTVLPKERAALEQIRRTELMNMTPLAALNFLHELKQKLSE
ncbi:DNA mismatch repair protein MutS [Xylanibacillus composti]|nr:DNA mismatch repair protein MutS [Xylanibacillus composti]MDT9725576.1 DNA mismatch repair protein MutS [Xylanibacillus composti]